jgi:hypothetical protein
MRPRPEEPIERFIPHHSHMNGACAESTPAFLLAFDCEEELQLSHGGEELTLCPGKMRVVLDRGLNDES